MDGITRVRNEKCTKSAGAVIAWATSTGHYFDPNVVTICIVGMSFHAEAAIVVGRLRLPKAGMA